MKQSLQLSTGSTSNICFQYPSGERKHKQMPSLPEKFPGDLMLLHSNRVLLSNNPPVIGTFMKNTGPTPLQGSGHEDT